MKTYFDIEGDGGSNVIGQVVAHKEAIGRALSGIDHLVAVGSGKGGVGKSTVTMALAQALAARGKKVAILDADFNGPTQAHLAGLGETPWVPGPDGLTLPRRPDGVGVLSLGSLLAPGGELRFVTVSSGEQQTWRGTREFAMLGQMLASVEWGKLDVLLFDLPPGAERTVQYAEFLGDRVAFVLVTVPSELARGVVARSVTALEGVAGVTTLGYVENMAGYYCRDCGEIKPLFPRRAATPLALPCLGEIPFDPELAALCDRGWPADAIRDLPALTAVDAVAGLLLHRLDTRSSDDGPEETAP
jgi:ATP-binding protein involved in chromosome partitioning